VQTKQKQEIIITLSRRFQKTGKESDSVKDWNSFGSLKVLVGLEVSLFVLSQGRELGKA
jgi:hypothetical protein